MKINKPYDFNKHLPAIAHLLGIGQRLHGLKDAAEEYLPVFISFCRLFSYPYLFYRSPLRFPFYWFFLRFLCVRLNDF